MRSFVLSLAAMLAFAGTSAAQTNPAGSVTPQVLRGTSADPETKKKPAAGAKTAAPAKKVTTQKAAAAAPATRRATPETLRAARYGGFAPAQPPGPPPPLDTVSPRSLSLVSFNTQETLTVTYWSNGAYHRDDHQHVIGRYLAGDAQRAPGKGLLRHHEHHAH